MTARPLLAAASTRHLDLGCGAKPRNPYGRQELHAVDIAPPAGGIVGATFASVNLAFDPLPYADGSFDSVSAYDFLEHVPRVALDHVSRTSRLPFIELMNEVHRVLVPGGLFYASTPCFPHDASFGDPTHVNHLTVETHEYFTRPTLRGRMYGFRGDFERLRVELFTPDEHHVYQPPVTGLARRAARKLRRTLRLRPPGTHILWELRAIKPDGVPPPVNRRP